MEMITLLKAKHLVEWEQHVETMGGKGCRSGVLGFPMREDVVQDLVRHVLDGGHGAWGDVDVWCDSDASLLVHRWDWVTIYAFCC